jgi:integrase
VDHNAPSAQPEPSAQTPITNPPPFAPDGGNTPIQDALDQFISSLAHRSPYTRKTYKNAIIHLSAYLGANRIPPSASVKCITLQWYERFIQELENPEMRRDRYQDQKPVKRSKPTSGKQGNTKTATLSWSSRELIKVATKAFLLFLVRRHMLHFEPEDYRTLEEILHSVQATKQVTLVTPIADEVYAAMIRVTEMEITEAEARFEERPRSHKNTRRNEGLWCAVLRAYRNAALLPALLSTGMRVAEARDLKRIQLNRKPPSASVMGKGKRERIVYFSQTAWKAIQKYFRKREDGVAPRELGKLPVFAAHTRPAAQGLVPLSTSTIEREFRRIYWRARDEDPALQELHVPTPHKLRHYFATRVLESSGDLAVTQDMLGHQSPVTTRRYAQVANKRMKTVHEKAFDDKPGEPKEQ